MILYTTAMNLLAAGAGSITGEESVLFEKNPPDYTDTQIVAGLVFDILVELILISFLCYVGYKTYGGLGNWFRRQKTTETAG
jgi:hypothetical protein